ncbi:hypothetical protein MLD38_036808 [Melastoma candidum]|uniref:Uncharacterized protein n=1 Tax=Melastoma candidum TaxID=119954 RepID=A0ACB9LL20_9MYRT|nr:hypothetical protein MLD38_036808 [Melastoma candidum]
MKLTPTVSGGGRAPSIQRKSCGSLLPLPFPPLDASCPLAVLVFLKGDDHTRGTADCPKPPTNFQMVTSWALNLQLVSGDDYVERDQVARSVLDLDLELHLIHPV